MVNKLAVNILARFISAKDYIGDYSRIRAVPKADYQVHLQTVRGLREDLKELYGKEAYQQRCDKYLAELRERHMETAERIWNKWSARYRKL